VSADWSLDAQRLAERARRALLTTLQRLDARVAHSGQLLSALSYRGVLARGFALVRDEQGHAIHAAAAIGPGARLSIEFADGRVGATADADRPAATTPAASPGNAPTREAKPSAPKRVSKPVDQGSLFWLLVWRVCWREPVPASLERSG